MLTSFVHTLLAEQAERTSRWARGTASRGLDQNEFVFNLSDLLAIKKRTPEGCKRFCGMGGQGGGRGRGTGVRLGKERKRRRGDDDETGFLFSTVTIMRKRESEED